MKKGQGTAVSPVEIVSVWNEPFTNNIIKGLSAEAAKRFRKYSLPDSLKAWHVYRDEIRKRIISAMALDVDHELPLNMKITGEVKRDSYTIKKVCYRSTHDRFVTGNLYIPDGKGPFPAVINMHGHWAQGRLAKRVQARGHVLALSGYVCLCVDAFGSGERSDNHGMFEYHGANLGAGLMNIGETLIGIQVADNMRGVDLLCSLPFVDKSRIGATGASGGGNQTMWLAAMDERVKAAVPVVSVGSFESYVNGVNCVCELLPGGLNICEEYAVVGLVAPRAFKMCNCLRDSNHTFYVSEMLRTYKEARKVYRHFGADENLSYQAFDLEHGYWPEISGAMLGFFDLHLKGIGHGAPHAEPEHEACPEEELQVFKKGKRPSYVTGISEYTMKHGTAVKKHLAARQSLKLDALRGELARKLSVDADSCDSIKEIFFHGTGSIWEKFTLETHSGKIIPVLMKKTPVGKYSKYYILSAATGKKQLEDSKIFKEAVSDKNAGILLFDICGSGETSNMNRSENSFLPHYHDLARSYLWFGKPLLGEWVSEYRAIGQYALDVLGADEIILGGFRDAGVAALFTAALFGCYDGVKAEQVPSSLLNVSDNWKKGELCSKSGVNNAFYSLALAVPSILKVCDISLASVMAGCPVDFISLRHLNGTELSDSDTVAFTDECVAFAEHVK